MARRSRVLDPAGMAVSLLSDLRGRLGRFSLSPRLRDDGLIRCPQCGKDTVNPVRWEEHDDSRWWIRLRCGGCGTARDVIAPDASAKRLDRDLQLGLMDIAAAARRLERARMRADVVTLKKALERDLIAPDDFSRRAARASFPR